MTSPAVPQGVRAQPLRLGLLIDSFAQPRWVCWALRRVIEQGLARPALVVVNASAAQGDKNKSRLSRLVRKRKQLGFALYSRIDKLAFPVADDPLELEDLTPLVAGVPQLHVEPRRTAHSDYFSDNDIARILEAKLDVGLRLGFRILRGCVLDIARLGVWSYHHGDNRVNRGGPPAVWEVLRGDATTGAVLQVLTESLDNGHVLARTWVHTQPWSVNRNRAHLYWHAAPLLERALRDVRAGESGESGESGEGVEGGEGTLRPDSAPPPLTAYNRRLYVAPTNAEMLRGAARLARRASGRLAAKYLRSEQWSLAYLRSPNEGTPDLTPYRFRLIIPPADRFWADPFPVHADGRDWVFFEDLRFTDNRGRISVLELNADGVAAEPRPVLDLPHHLSYPFLFRHAGVWYLMPESRARSQVDVYRALSFPFEWTHDRVMLQGVTAVDPTLARIDGRWWLFANVAEERRSSWIELHAFCSDSPFGPWTPHRRNPIVSDVRSARPAGKLFQRNGVWYRPAQDCSSGYGAAINIQRLVRLSPDDYLEVPETRVEATWRPNLLGVHTINASETLTVIDVNRRRWRWQR